MAPPRVAAAVAEAAKTKKKTAVSVRVPSRKKASGRGTPAAKKTTPTKEKAVVADESDTAVKDQSPKKTVVVEYWKKNIFKLAQGEYIAPVKVENFYSKCKFVAQCFVYGDSLNSCLVAVISVDQDVLKAWATSEGIRATELGREPTLVEMLVHTHTKKSDRTVFLVEEQKIVKKVLKIHGTIICVIYNF